MTKSFFSVFVFICLSPALCFLQDAPTAQTQIATVDTNINANIIKDFSEVVDLKDPKVLKKQLKQNKNLVTLKDQDSKTLLMTALKQNAPKKVVKTILKQNAPQNLQDKNGKTSLMYASQYCKDKDTVKMVLKHKSFLGFGLKKRVKQKDSLDFNSFDYSRVNENPQVTRLLEKYIKNQDKSPLSLDEIALKIELQEHPRQPPAPPIKHSLMDDMPQDIIDQYENSKTPGPQKTYLFDFLDETQALLNEPPEDLTIKNPNTQDINGVTPLMVAAKIGDEKLAKKLILSGAFVNAQDKALWSPLMYAARYCPKAQMVTLLIQNGANVFLKDSFGIPALQLAINYNPSEKVVQAILSQYDMQKDQCLDFFFMALVCQKNADLKTKCFIDMGQSVNSPKNGKTPLMQAAYMSKSTAVLKVLLDSGANAYIKDTQGKSAFDYAKENSSLLHDDTYWRLNVGHN